jgi:hypothetical protein
MKQFNLANNDLFTVFIPKEVINDTEGSTSSLGTWISFNERNENFLKSDVWCNCVHTITKLTNDLIVVIFNETFNDLITVRHSIAIYRGELY